MMESVILLEETKKSNNWNRKNDILNYLEKIYLDEEIDYDLAEDVIVHNDAEKIIYSAIIEKLEDFRIQKTNLKREIDEEFSEIEKNIINNLSKTCKNKFFVIWSIYQSHLYPVFINIYDILKKCNVNKFIYIAHKICYNEYNKKERSR